MATPDDKLASGDSVAQREEAFCASGVFCDGLLEKKSIKFLKRAFKSSQSKKVSSIERMGGWLVSRISLLLLLFFLYT